MTSRADMGQGGFDMLDVEGMLESYVLATRIVASEPFVSRIHDRLAQEPPLTPWRRAWNSVRDLASMAFGREHVAAAIRLQALALLILGALVLGVAVGGAGTVVVYFVRDVIEAQPGPYTPNQAFPVATQGATPSVPSAAPTSTNNSPDPKPTQKPKAGGSHHSGDTVSRHPTHVGSAAGGAQPTRAPRPTHSPRPTQAPPTPAASDGGVSPSPTISATPGPTETPTPTDTADPSPDPSASPEQSPEASATANSTAPPTETPTEEPFPETTPVPSIAPTAEPSPSPS